MGTGDLGESSSAWGALGEAPKNDMLEEYQKQEKERKFWPEDNALKTLLPGLYSCYFHFIMIPFTFPFKFTNQSREN